MSLATRKCAVLLCGGLLAGLGASAAHGAIVAQYPFTASSLSSTDADANSSATDLTKGWSNIFIDTANGNAAPAIEFPTDNNNTNSAALAVTNNHYLEFTVTPNLGFPLYLDELTFDLAADGLSSIGGGFTTHVFVRSSLDSYATTIGSEFSNGVSDKVIGPFEAQTLDLSAPAYQGLTSPITFRVYSWAGSSSTTKGALLDNVTLTTVPEPATIGLMTLGATGMLLRRRRHA